MERYAWKGKVAPGMHAEYKKRHAEIWPEMVAVLKEAGICHYSIWMTGDELIMEKDQVTGAQPLLELLFWLELFIN